MEKASGNCVWLEPGFEDFFVNKSRISIKKKIYKKHLENHTKFKKKLQISRKTSKKFKSM